MITQTACFCRGGDDCCVRRRLVPMVAEPTYDPKALEAFYGPFKEFLKYRRDESSRPQGTGAPSA